MKRSTQYILVRRGPGPMRPAPAQPLSAARYTVLERLGAGATATVHRATEHLATGAEREVTLKRLLPHLAEDPAAVDAFVRRATRAGRLLHPGIARVHGVGRGGTGWFLSREHVPGHDLAAVLRRCQDVAVAPPSAVIRSLRDQLDAALARIHAARDEQGRPLGLSHGDLCPGNLLVERTGRLVLTDAGAGSGAARADLAAAAALLPALPVAPASPAEVAAWLEELFEDTLVFRRAGGA